ncbi:MAG: hypothetical protein JNJ54_21870 [Myxococcaceae bacterium]|nr:hypothetical protein [Myxococcaceae bacterium]
MVQPRGRSVACVAALSLLVGCRAPTERTPPVDAGQADAGDAAGRDAGGRAAHLAQLARLLPALQSTTRRKDDDEAVWPDLSRVPMSGLVEATPVPRCARPPACVIDALTAGGAQPDVWLFDGRRTSRPRPAPPDAQRALLLHLPRGVVFSLPDGATEWTTGDGALLGHCIAGDPPTSWSCDLFDLEAGQRVLSAGPGVRLEALARGVATLTFESVFVPEWCRRGDPEERRNVRRDPPALLSLQLSLAGPTRLAAWPTAWDLLEADDDHPAPAIRCEGLPARATGLPLLPGAATRPSPRPPGR